MKIVLLATTEQKEELTAQQLRAGIDLIWLAGPEEFDSVAGADACIDLLFDDSAERMNMLKRLNPGTLVINSIIPLSIAGASDCIRINGWNTFLKRATIEATGNPELKQRAETLFAVFNKSVDWVPDITGFISLRVIASIINEAYFSLDENVSTKEEIDIAMKLGTNYPYGPFEWGEKIGIKNICRLLEQLSREQERYKPSVLLVKEAAL